MTTTARSSKRKEKWNRPVSKKFYDHIISQIRTTASLSSDINADNVIRCLEEYLTHRTATADFTETESVVFTLLQPLIDQAMRRSDRARHAAALPGSPPKAIPSSHPPKHPNQTPNQQHHNSPHENQNELSAAKPPSFVANKNTSNASVTAIGLR